MTIKEAFKELKENAQEIYEWELDRLKIIEKDLERLEKLEDIEEKLGCPLEVMFKALKQMFVFHKENEKIELLGLHIKFNELYLYGFVEDTIQAVHLSLKDYGKTWTLTKEEWLEHDS